MVSACGIGLRCVAFVLAALVVGQAAAQLPKDTKVLSCDSAMYRSLLDAPVTDVRRDLGIALYVADQLRDLSYSQATCEPGPGRRYNVKQLLLGYFENRWIAETLDEQIEPIATVRDALVQQSARDQRIAASQEAQAEFEARRLSAYQRSLVIQIPDAIPSPDEVTIDVRNGSSWTVHLYPHNLAGGRWPVLQFQAAPESVPIRFDCGYGSRADEVASGAQAPLTCRRQPPTTAAGQPSEPAAPALSGSAGIWTLHPGDKLRGLGDVSQSDVGVATTLVIEQANALVARSTCKSRNSCDQESEIRHTGDNDLWMMFLPIGFAFLLALVLPRFSAYVLGPAVVVLAVGFAIVERKLFMPFQSDGSPAGVLVPGIMWLLLIVCCIVGAALIGTGLARIRARNRSRAAAPSA